MAPDEAATPGRGPSAGAAPAADLAADPAAAPAAAPAAVSTTSPAPTAQRARVLDGRPVARTVRAEVRARVEALRARGVQPKLVVLLVGGDPGSEVYVRLKESAAAKVGIASEVIRLPADATQAQALHAVRQANGDPEVHGVLVQLPLPGQLHARPLLHAIHPSKDVDGFHPVNVGHLASDGGGLVPCTPKGIMRLLAAYDVTVRGAHAVVVGRSRVVGRPMAASLLAAHATVTVCHRLTRDPAALARQADILVCAVGQPGLVDAGWVKPGATVVDVGITRTQSGLRGDCDVDSVAPLAGALTPVPGGVGPMTIAMLLDNTCEAAERQLHGGAGRDPGHTLA